MVRLGGGLYSLVFSLFFLQLRLDEDLLLTTLFNLQDGPFGRALLSNDDVEDDVEGMGGQLGWSRGSGGADREVESNGLGKEGEKPKGSKAML